MLSHELSRFKNREVRDLAWALLSPCIIKGELIQDKGVIKSISENEESLIIWLENLDFEPNDLQTFLENKKTSKRLGKYFENLLHFAFLNLSSIRETHFSIQVKQDKSTTIGEFDFLIQSDDNSRWTHLEVAVKFYLVSEEAIGSHQIKTWFIGPNRKDRLDLKLKKLYEHQLKLGSHTCGQKKLSSLGIHSLKKELVVKGYLFYNFKMNQSLQTPDYINEYALKGWWSELHDFPFDSLQDKFFVALNKNDPEIKEEYFMDLIIKDLGKSFKPDKIIFVSDLPKTRNMKIMRRVIKTCLTNQDPGDISTLLNPESVEEIKTHAI